MVELIAGAQVETEAPALTAADLARIDASIFAAVHGPHIPVTPAMLPPFVRPSRSRKAAQAQ